MGICFFGLDVVSDEWWWRGEEGGGGGGGVQAGLGMVGYGEVGGWVETDSFQ